MAALVNVAVTVLVLTNPLFLDRKCMCPGLSQQRDTLNATHRGTLLRSRPIVVVIPCTLVRRRRIMTKVSSVPVLVSASGRLTWALRRLRRVNTPPSELNNFTTLLPESGEPIVLVTYISLERTRTTAEC